MLPNIRTECVTMVFSFYFSYKKAYNLLHKQAYLVFLAPLFLFKESLIKVEKHCENMSRMTHRKHITSKFINLKIKK